MFQKPLTLVFVLGFSLAGLAQADWEETFDNNSFDLSSWTFYSYPISATFNATIQDVDGSDDYLALDDLALLNPGHAGSAFGIGFGSDELFTDARIGATVNVTGDAAQNYQGIAVRASYVLAPEGIVASAYIMHVNWEDGPANLKLDVEKVVNLQNIMAHSFTIAVPGIAHGRSYYAELEAIGSNPVYVTGSLYEYKGGPLVARIPTMIDTNGNDWWEDAGVNDAVFTDGLSGIFSQNENDNPQGQEPAGYHTTFDDISADANPVAALQYPADGATDIPLDPNISWVEVDRATDHNIWFGPAGAMQKIDLAADVRYWQPGPLQAGTTYQLRIDQIVPEGTIPGRIYSFKTVEQILIDDFEGYDPEVITDLRTVWDPNLPNTGTGLNYIETAADKVAQGTKSMRFEYNEQVAPYKSEVSYTFDQGQDWAGHNLKTLAFELKGNRNNVALPIYVTLIDTAGKSASATHPLSYAIQADNWFQVDIPLNTFADNGVDLSAVKQIIMGVGSGTDPGEEPEGTTHVVYVDNIRLYQLRCLNPHNLDMRADANGDCQVNFQDFLILAGSWMNNAMEEMP